MEVHKMGQLFCFLVAFPNWASSNAILVVKENSCTCKRINSVDKVLEQWPKEGREPRLHPDLAYPFDTERLTRAKRALSFLWRSSPKNNWGKNLSGGKKHQSIPRLDPALTKFEQSRWLQDDLIGVSYSIRSTKLLIWGYGVIGSVAWPIKGPR